MKQIIITLILIIVISVNTVVADHPNGTIKVDIYGLVCDFCARALEKVFSKENSVDSIDVNLNSKIVTIHLKNGYDLDDDIIERNIIDAGYNIEEIRRDG